ncbi:hypothetical protein DZ860_16015 [Vibrio sinensis]|uniref:GNAT family N-acetyltransferase n=1 Tax=Vibrio sinensis TaxID=2302434 RepID=A0A3A6QC26_9VIBR|nr:hypothetical protein [Vibrio sinensis]RJX68944.1 hypothetical protein DZ860_16015 [Vibrio sinensis]
MKIIEVTEKNAHVYVNLSQAYEGEFSKIMQKKPNIDGTFSLDTELGGHVKGYLLYVDDIPAGHTAIATESPNNYEVCDFYIVPYFRRGQLGQQFISELFHRLQGDWEIKQVEGADHAVMFWRRVINSYTAGQFSEDRYHDEKWGMVTRQRFSHRA